MKKFWRFVDKTETCWLWAGNKTQTGYGRIGINYKGILAHRLSWELAHGPIPKGLVVCHRCDTPLCVRPDHLFLGTLSENHRDMVAKGRHARGSKQGAAKLSEADIADIRAAICAGSKQQELADKYGVTQAGISAVHRRVNWKHVA